jgi:hypothetical protein
MESKGEITHSNCTPALSKVGSVLRGRDLEQRERKLSEAQQQLVKDRHVLEAQLETTQSVNEQTVSYLSTELADSMGQTVQCQARIDALHLQMEELRTNSQIESNAEVVQVRKRLVNAKNVTTQKQEEHEKLYTELQKDVDMYTNRMQLQLKDVTSKLKGTATHVGDLTSKLEGSETRVSDLMAQLAEKHSQLVELSEQLVVSEAGYKTMRQQGALNNAKHLDQHQKFAFDQNEKLGHVSKQLDDSKNEMEKHKTQWQSEATKTTVQIKKRAMEYKQSMETEKKRTDSIIAENHEYRQSMEAEMKRTNSIIAENRGYKQSVQAEKKRTDYMIAEHRLDIDNARTESERLSDIIDGYETSSKNMVDRSENSDNLISNNSDTLRNMIMSSLPADLEMHGIGTTDDIVKKVMLSMGSHE